MPALTIRLGRSPVLLMIAALGAAPAAHAQWNIAMRAIYNPLPPGQCTPIEIVVTDANGATPLRPDGRQLDWQDFELSFAASSPDAFSWSDERHRYLCARTPTAASAVVVARYPGSHLQPHERLPGVVAQQSVEVAMQVGSPAAVPTATPYPTTHDQSPVAGAQAGQPQPVTPTAPASGYVPPPPSGYGQSPGDQYSRGQPHAAPPSQAQAQPSYPEPPAPAATNPGQPYTPPGYTAAPAPAPAHPAQAAPVPAAAVPLPPQEAEPAVKSVGGLFKKIGKHVKKKAGDVTSEAVQNLASTATQVVDTTLETGGGLVTGTTAEASNAARMTIGGVGQSLLPSAIRGGGHSDNLVTVLASGHAVLRMMRFTGATDVLEPSARALAQRLAEALKQVPGNFVIEAHVDPLPSPAASQQLSEHRAAAVKRTLVGHGVEAQRLLALGYGASEPQPEVPPDGGAPSSSRIEVLRTQ